MSQPAKVCHGCDETDLSKFVYNTYVKKDGTKSLRSHCNACRATGARHWYSDNTNRGKETRRRYSEENKEALKQKELEYREQHREEARSRAAEWYKENPERGKANAKVAGHKRRARIAKVGGRFTKADIRNLYSIQGACCYYCSTSIKEGYEIEHMLPISRGGSNGPDNLCLACAPCNRSKHTKTAEEFISG